jgi:hypothetical protein
MLKNKKRIALMIAVLMLVLSFSTTGFATWATKTLQASYRNISIYVNGVAKQAKTANGVIVEPFIVDGTTYVPLRGISDILGYQISFNPTTYRIDITGADVASLAAQVIQKDARIKELETQLAKYTAISIRDVQDDLEDDYTKIGTVDIENIILKGDEDDIELQVYVDLTATTDYEAWKAVSDTTKKSTIQNMVDDILDVYGDATITGFVQDDFDDTKVLKFTLDSRDNVILGNTDSLLDLEDELNDRFYRYYYETGKYVAFEIFVDGDEDDIQLEIEIDDAEFDILYEEEIEEYLKDVYTEVQDWFDGSSVEGEIVDGSTVLATFYFTSRGTLYLTIK